MVSTVFFYFFETYSHNAFCKLSRKCDLHCCIIAYMVQYKLWIKEKSALCWV